MKRYEAVTRTQLIPLLPTLARVDGRSFHAFTKGMERPYDMWMVQAMRDTAMALVKETGARTAYTQSDEITLLWYSDRPGSQIWFDGDHTKMVSQIAAQATLHFYRACLERMPEHARKLPTFDGRVWQVPNKEEAANVFRWREWDATKNSITMAASSVYTEEELHGKNGSQKQDMLWQKGINWNDYPAFFKRGTFIHRRVVRSKFTVHEIEKLPEKHHARTNPDLEVERNKWVHVKMPPIGSVINLEAVIFDGANPMATSNTTLD